MKNLKICSFWFPCWATNYFILTSCCSGCFLWQSKNIFFLVQIMTQGKVKHEEFLISWMIISLQGSTEKCHLLEESKGFRCFIIKLNVSQKGYDGFCFTLTKSRCVLEGLVCKKQQPWKIAELALIISGEHLEVSLNKAELILLVDVKLPPMCFCIDDWAPEPEFTPRRKTFLNV